MVCGNHEEAYAKIDRGEYPLESGAGERRVKTHAWQLRVHKWLREHLKPEYYERMLNLPTEFRLRLNDEFSVIGFHAALGCTVSPTCGAFVPAGTLREVYGGLAENVVIYGHYHEPHVIPLDGKLLVNCASVGMRIGDCYSNYTVVEYDDEKIAVVQRQVLYDGDEDARLVWERGHPREL